MNSGFLFYLMVAALAAPFAYADDASDLNNLQRQIEAAKAAKKSKPAAAAPAKPAPEIIRQDADALRMANLTVQSDAPCILSVNGEKKTTLSAGVSSVKVPSGKSLVTCRSTDSTNVEFSGEVSARAGENSVLRIELAGAIADANHKAAEKEAKRIAALRWEAECKQNPWLMEDAGDGVLRQCVTGLLWTQRDNGADIAWNNATLYCSAKGDWRLPTRDELNSLVRMSETTPCGDFTCNVSSKFRLTDPLFWTNERNGSSEAWSVNLSSGNQTSYQLDFRYFKRALCVRRP